MDHKEVIRNQIRHDLSDHSLPGEIMSLSLTDTIGQARPLQAVRVLVVDDHPMVRHGLSALIAVEAGFEVCAQADSEESALQAIKDSRPHLAVIGLSGRKTSTLELVRRVQMVAPEVRVLVSSMHEDTLHAERALKAGAMAFLCKSDSVQDTVDALRRVREGKIYLSDALSERMLHRVAHGNEPDESSPFDLLSDRELQVFERYGQGLTTQEIATQLYLSTKTVDTHRQRIKQKLELRSTNEVIWAASQFLWKNR
jgi:DNA-binding NarL/FixJ family response regulator